MTLMKVFWFLLLIIYVQSFKTSFQSHGLTHVQKRGSHFQMLAQTDVNMPALSSTMKEGKIVSWNKKIGDKVSAGDVLLVVESDKADMDVESFEDGYLAVIHTPEGGSALVGSAVATIVTNKDEISAVGKPVVAVAAKTEITVPTPDAATVVTTTPSLNAPKFEQILMPALSSTMKEGKIVAWSKKVGDKISSGDMVLVVESDKADMDVESYEDGFLAVISVADGQVAQVGSPVGYIAKSKEAIGEVQSFVASGGRVDQAVVTTSAPIEAGSKPKVCSSEKDSSCPSPSTTAAPAVVVNSGRVSASGYAQAQAREQGINLHTVNPSRSDKYIVSSDLNGVNGGAPYVHSPAPGVINATPMARKLAADNSLDIAKIKGTGNFNRVTQEDVLRAAGKLPAEVTAAVVTAPKATTGAASTATAVKTPAAVVAGIKAMDGMQKAVAKNMEKTLSIPVFRVSREIVTDQFDALYASLKSKGVSVSALLAKAVSEVLKKHPIMNAAYSPENGGGIKFNKDTNIAMAVAIDGGLITPTIVGAQDMDLFSVARRWKDLVDKAKGKKLTPAEYSSGTFTISNLGMFGVQQFDAILPPGTGSILAIAAALPRVVQQKNGHFGVQKSMTVTITCDHRHIYGADAAEFLKDLADLLENNVHSLTMG